MQRHIPSKASVSDQCGYRIVPYYLAWSDQKTESKDYGCIGKKRKEYHPVSIRKVAAGMTKQFFG